MTGTGVLLQQACSYAKHLRLTHCLCLVPEGPVGHAISSACVWTACEPQLHVQASTALVASSLQKLLWGTELQNPCLLLILPDEQLARQACTIKGQGTPSGMLLAIQGHATGACQIAL